jgi:hypothetical protein
MSSTFVQNRLFSVFYRLFILCLSLAALLGCNNSVYFSGPQNSSVDKAKNAPGVQVLRSAGELTPAFGHKGISILPLEGDATFSHSIQDSDERIILTGWVNRTGKDSLVLARVLPDGNLDPACGEQGYVLAPDIDGLGTRGNGVALRSNGEIWIAGSSFANLEQTDVNNPKRRTTVFRFSANCQLLSAIPYPPIGERNWGNEDALRLGFLLNDSAEDLFALSHNDGAVDATNTSTVVRFINPTDGVETLREERRMIRPKELVIESNKPVAFGTFEVHPNFSLKAPTLSRYMRNAHRFQDWSFGKSGWALANVPDNSLSELDKAVKALWVPFFGTVPGGSLELFLSLFGLLIGPSNISSSFASLVAHVGNYYSGKLVDLDASNKRFMCAGGLDQMLGAELAANPAGLVLKPNMSLSIQNLDGSLDEQWGGTGYRHFKVGEADSEAFDAVMDNTHFYLVGSAQKNGRKELAILRVDRQTAEPDRTFGSEGTVFLDLGGDETFTRAYSAQDDTLVLVGTLKESVTQTGRIILVRIYKR